MLETHTQLLEGGCTAWGNDEERAYELEDPRKLRQTLDSRLLFDETARGRLRGGGCPTGSRGSARCTPWRSTLAQHDPDAQPHPLPR